MATNCPSCASSLADLPDGAQKCSQCGAFLNVEACPHCQAKTALIRAGGAHRCAACSKVRTRKPFGPVLESGHGSMASVFIGLSLAATSAFFAASIFAYPLVFLGLAAGTGAVAFGLWSQRQGAMKQDTALRAGEIKQDITALLEDMDVISASQAAARLGVERKMADAILGDMAENLEVEMKVDDAGRIAFAKSRPLNLEGGAFGRDILEAAAEEAAEDDEAYSTRSTT